MATPRQLQREETADATILDGKELRRVELEEIRKKKLAKLGKEQHDGASPPQNLVEDSQLPETRDKQWKPRAAKSVALPTFDTWQMHQKAIREAQRSSQDDAYRRLHGYRLKNVDDVIGVQKVERKNIRDSSGTDILIAEKSDFAHCKVRENVLPASDPSFVQGDVFSMHVTAKTRFYGNEGRCSNELKSRTKENEPTGEMFENTQHSDRLHATGDRTIINDSVKAISVASVPHTCRNGGQEVADVLAGDDDADSTQFTPRSCCKAEQVTKTKIDRRFDDTPAFDANKIEKGNFSSHVTKECDEETISLEGSNCRQARLGWSERKRQVKDIHRSLALTSNTRVVADVEANENPGGSSELTRHGKSSSSLVTCPLFSKQADCISAGNKYDEMRERWSPVEATIPDAEDISLVPAATSLSNEAIQKDTGSSRLNDKISSKAGEKSKSPEGKLRITRLRDGRFRVQMQFSFGILTKRMANNEFCSLIEKCMSSIEKVVIAGLSGRSQLQSPPTVSSVNKTALPGQTKPMLQTVRSVVKVSFAVIVPFEEETHCVYNSLIATLRKAVKADSF